MIQTIPIEVVKKSKKQLETAVMFGNQRITTFREAAECCAAYLLQKGGELVFYHVVEKEEGAASFRVDITDVMDERREDDLLFDEIQMVTIAEVESVSPVAGLLLKLPRAWGMALVHFLQHPWWHLNNSSWGYKDWPATAAYAWLDQGWRHAEGGWVLLGEEAKGAMKPMAELSGPHGPFDFATGRGYHWQKEPNVPAVHTDHFGSKHGVYAC